MLAPHHVVVLLDPSSQLGERSLDYALDSLSPEPSLITLLVTLNGQMAQPFRELAAAEQIDLPEAADQYLNQLARKAEREGLEVRIVSVLGDDLAADISDLAASSAQTEAPFRTVVAPSKIARLDPAFVTRVALSLSIPVIVVPTDR